MLTKEISEVEKGFRKLSLSIKPTDKEVETMSEYEWMIAVYPRQIYERTLKSCQAKFDKFMKEVKQKVLIDWKGQNEFIDFIDELSQREGDEE